MSQLKLKEVLTGTEIGNKLRVKRPLSDTGRPYANTTIKSTRNRLLLISWKPRAEREGGERWLREREAAVNPSNRFGHMFGPLPPAAADAGKSARPSEAQIYCAFTAALNYTCSRIGGL